MNFVEVAPTVTLADQLREEGGPAVLADTLVIPPEDADALLAAWTQDTAVMKRQPGFPSTQVHRDIAGSGVFLDVAVWKSPARFRAAFANPAFREKPAGYPPTATASPHLFRKLADPGLCAA